MKEPGKGVLTAVAVVLFLVWCNSFVANSFLLGGERSPARLDWIELPVVRFVPLVLLCGVYCFGFRFAESAAIVRRRWKRLAAAGFFCVPAYNLALAYGQQHGVPPPIASLETALAPLFLMVLGAAVLKERVSLRKAAGFMISLAGLAMIAAARPSQGGFQYGGLILITALAPLSWSFYSILSKPVMGECSALLWTYLSVFAGSLWLAALAPLHGAEAFARLDLAGWAAVGYLSLFCTLFGFAVWTWLLRHLPASSLGFTIFLNPPLTTMSKAAMSALLPAVFMFQIVTGEWIGGAVVLSGMAVALARSPRREGALRP